MPRDGNETKQRILDAAQAQVMEKGFAATSVDDIQQAAGISRGTFFYHFPSKDDLARALIVRYGEADHTFVEGFRERAERLATDPLQRALIFLALHEDVFQEMQPDEAGCLFASFSYEAGVLDDESEAVIVESIEHWRRVLGGMLEEAMLRHPPAVDDVDPYVLADVAYGVFQGAFILSRSLGDKGLMSSHIREFRRYLEVLFGVVPTGGIRTEFGSDTQPELTPAEGD